MSRTIVIATAAAAGFLLAATAPGWKHLSSANGDIAPPNGGKEQTSATVFDIDKDGVNDFVITERTAAPAVVWYRRTSNGWQRRIIEPAHLQPEAGATFMDVDGDGDLDFIAAGDYSSNEVWWWENPFPELDAVSWKRHVIKNSGAKKHHDLIAADVLGQGIPQLIFWNQDAHKLLLARVPEHPRTAGPWALSEIYSYSADSEPEQRGKPASFKSVNEHEGLAVADVDLDGRLDIVGGGRWFKYLGEGKWQTNLVDPNYSFSRAGAGQLVKGNRPEIVLVVGDGLGPLNWYEWVKGTWVPHKLADVDNGHSLEVRDIDGDGNLDIFLAEMRLNGGNPESKIYFFYGNGRGDFRKEIIDTGYDLHESKLADLDGNGTLDILGKPYNYGTPGLHIWLREH